MSFDPSGRGSLWLRKSGEGVRDFVLKLLGRLAALENPKAPIFSGVFAPHRDLKRGEEIEVAFWFDQKTLENEKRPILWGKSQDKRTPSGRTSGVNPSYQPPPLDDDFPF